MAKKESKKNKKAKGKNLPPQTAAGTATGVPPTTSVPPTSSVPPTASVPPTGGATSFGIPPTTQPIDQSKLSPEQLAQVQLEQAIKESTDPSAKLKKLKSPLSVGGCLLNLLFLIVLTVIIVYIIVAIKVDKFNFVTVSKDMLDKFGISDLFSTIGNWFKRIFSGGK